MRDRSQSFDEIVFDIIKPAGLMLLTFAILAIFAGVFMPLHHDALYSIGIWFAMLIGAVTTFCVLVYRWRARTFFSDESPGEFLAATLTDLLGVLGLGPFAFVLYFAILQKPKNEHWFVELIVPVLATVLFFASIRNIYRRLTSE